MDNISGILDTHDRGGKPSRSRRAGKALGVVASATVVLLLGGGGKSYAQPPVQDAPLIERAKLFGNPTRRLPRVSPDGRWVSWLAPHEGVMNLWVAPLGDLAQAKLLTREQGAPIRNYSWAPDSRTLLISHDRNGDENFVIFGVDIATGQHRALTPTDKTRAQIVAIQPAVKDRILVSFNNRDPRWSDLYSLDLRTGSLNLVFLNNGFSSFLTDHNLVLRGLVRRRPDGGSDVFKASAGDVSAEPFATIPYDDVRTTRPLAFTPDGRSLIWLDSRGGDRSALVAQDVETGVRRVIAENARADIREALFSPVSGQVDAYAVNYDKTQWFGLEPALQADFDFLRSQLGGEIEIFSRSEDDRVWVIDHDPADAPAGYHLYDRKARRLTKLFSSHAELDKAPLVRMHPVEIKSRDGLIQVGYLSLPPGSDPDGDGRPDRPVPMVLTVHGGPWEREIFEFDARHQLWANRGYAVLTPNFRGSTGFGKAFVNAGDGEWGGKMQDDLVDAVSWAVEQRVARRDKVAIVGGSYGGYAVLAALAFTPDVFACGVDLFGAADLESHLTGLASFREERRMEYYRRIGDPRTAEGRALLAARSPMHQASRISKPLLIAHGANDPRVKQVESDKIVETMRAGGRPVTYLVFPDEGHGFARPANDIAYTAVAEHFLADCLGGRAEPYGDDLLASSMTAQYGAGFVRGLASALARNGARAAR